MTPDESANASLRRTETHFDGSNGARLFLRRWDPPKPARQIVLVHGFAEHSGRYEAPSAWFASRGASVTGYDHRGHGHSSGYRGHVQCFDEFLDDLTVVIDAARERNPALPITVIGHSMGGLITCTWARERQPKIAGLVISSPLMAPPASITPARRRVLQGLRYVAPRFSIESELDASGLSRDPAVVNAYLADPRVYRKMTLSLASELFAATERTAPNGHEITLPMLMLHGKEDAICAPAASEAFARNVPNCRYRLVPGLRHEIFNEPEQEAVFDVIQTWIQERETAPLA